jgi:hypothetical protein
MRWIGFVCCGLALLGAPLRADGWRVRAEPVYAGQYAAVGDPSVIRAAGAGYLMYHHCLDVERAPQGAEICLARSPDGLHWRPAQTAEASALVRGRVLRSSAAQGWDAAHETPFALRVPGAIRLYVLGYQGASVFSDQASAGLGLVQSPIAGQFPAMGPPILRPSVAADQGGMTSPSVVAAPGGRVLYYTGWSCAMDRKDCAARVRLSLMAVRLDAKGLPKGRPRVVRVDPVPEWAQGGTSESTVILGPDGRYYLFFSALAGALAQRIGMGVAGNPFGPFAIEPEPIVEPNAPWNAGGVLAPDVMIVDGKVRLWFHGFETDAKGQITAARIGYAEHDWPVLP